MHDAPAAFEAIHPAATLLAALHHQLNLITESLHGPRRLRRLTAHIRGAVARQSIVLSSLSKVTYGSPGVSSRACRKTPSLSGCRGALLQAASPRPLGSW